MRISLVSEMNTRDLRRRSLKIARELGYAENESLPLLDDDIGVTRDKDAIVDRALCLYGTLSVAYGFDRKKALKWIEDQNLSESCTSLEREFLHGAGASSLEMKTRVEGLYVMAWVLGLYEDLDFTGLCPSDLVLKFPNIKENEPSMSFRAAVAVIDVVSIVGMADLAYCLHSAIREEELARRPTGRLPAYVIVERRRALEWLLSEDEFEDVSLDT